jgi:hypothetical protein
LIAADLKDVGIDAIAADADVRWWGATRSVIVRMAPPEVAAIAAAVAQRLLGGVLPVLASAGPAVPPPTAITSCRWRCHRHLGSDRFRGVPLLAACRSA